MYSILDKIKILAKGLLFVPIVVKCLVPNKMQNIETLTKCLKKIKCGI